MAEQAMQQRTAQAESRGEGARVSGPADARLTQLAAKLHSGEAVQRVSMEKEKLTQRMGIEKDKLTQHKSLEEELPAQRMPMEEELPAQRMPNRTGMPDGLKSGIETLSGMSMDHVRVHHNSSKPAQLNAHAYAQGSDIHLAPGQGHHLPHEAWHVVQQAQGRVQATMQMAAGVPVNDDKGLEHEADVMGAKAAQLAAMPEEKLTG